MEYLGIYLVMGLIIFGGIVGLTAYFVYYIVDTITGGD